MSKFLRKMIKFLRKIYLRASSPFRQQRRGSCSKFLRVDFQKQPWGYARIGDMEMSASLSVHEMGTFGVAIGDVVAVSHVWGDAQCVVENVQGASHQIKISSAEKMRHLLSIAERHGWENLWLDNICINQEDDDEKSREVMKMGYVYRETKATLILLDSTPSELLRETIPTILQHQIAPPTIEQLRTIERVIQLLGSLPGERGPLVDFQACIDKYLRLGEDEWYRRLWTVQESTLARKVYMAPIDEDDVVEASGLRDCQPFWLQLGKAASNFGWIKETNMDPRGRWIMNLLHRWAARTGHSFYQILRTTSHCECSVERDRVYGILGLLHDVNMTPKYDDTSLEEIAVTVMKESVNSTKEMDLVHLSGPKLEEMGKRMVPTWNSLIKSPRLLLGTICHDGNCFYDENLGLRIEKPRVFRTHIVGVIEPYYDPWNMDNNFNFSIPRVFRALKEKLHDDQRVEATIVEAIRGIMSTWELPEYGNEDKAREWFNIFAHLASLPFIISMKLELMTKYGWGPSQPQWAEFNTIRTDLRGVGAEKVYILGITKDNSCRCPCCRRTYISVIRSDALLEDNLLVVNYDGVIGNHVEGKTGDRVPFIVAEPVREGVMKFISTIVVDQGVTHESMACERDTVVIQ